MSSVIRSFAFGLVALSLPLITGSCSGNSSNTSKTFTTSLAQEAEPSVIALNSIVSVGAVGDVKYSILEPDKFTKENGEGWALMEGQDIKGTDLWKLTGIENLPDARGVFVRGLNRGRKIEEGDTAGDRQVGSYQADAFKNHSHPVGPLNLGWNTEGNGGRHRIDTDDGGTWGNYDVEQTAKAVGEAETRPRNIALFTYIKVSNPRNPEPSPTPEPSASGLATPQ